ncbi:MAG: flagellar assembly protein FliW [Desulfuromonadales bacterium C00003096]|jgi:flagellar assembly factor FliW|nr:MAG: flagellar assembly protein FliW [Desulfuromonadales bacterium C00003096]
MNKIQSRFGEIEYLPENLLHFPKGLIGFENLRDFIIMPNKKEGPLFWIQSVDDPQIAFVMTDPSNFFLEYQVAATPADRTKLGIGEKDEVYCLSVVTVPPDRKITLNLMAPVLYAPSSNRALQTILEKSPYTTRHPLPV